MSATVPVSVRRGFEPTPMQRALLASQLRHPGAPLQNMALLTHLDGPIDASRFADAFTRIVAASDALRSTFPVVDGVPRVVLADVLDEVPTEVVDVPRDAVGDWAARRAATPIDIERRAYDSVLLRHDDGTSSWYLAIHHAATDAMSSAIVFAETARAYHGETVELPSYYGWAAGLDRVDDPRRGRAARHWRDRAAASHLAQLYRPVRRTTPAATRVPVEVGPATWDRARAQLAGDLAMLTDDLGWTTLMVCVAALHAHRLSGSDQFSIGLPVHNRSDAAARAVVGPVMEVFPVDVVIEPDDSLRSLHRRIGRAVIATIRHARAGLASSSADHDVVVNVIPRAGLGDFGEVPATTRWIHTGATDPSNLMRLQLTAYGDDDVELVADLNDAAADEQHRARAGGHLRRILELLVSDPDRMLADVDVIGDDEAAAIERWSRGVPAPEARNVLDELEDALAGQHHLAIVDGDDRRTADEHWQRCRALSAWLRDRGVRPGVRVGVEMPRTADVITAIQGVLLAGGSYVPIDPDQPAARRERLVERAECTLVLREIPDELPPPDRAPDDWPGSDDEAYLMYTSGSTGEPKGVPITHRGLAEYVRFARDAFVDHDRPVAPLFSALTFDLTVTTLFVPLVAGGRLVVVRPDGPAGLREVATHHDLTWMKATPSHLELLRRAEPHASLRTLVVGGEAFGARLASQLRETFREVRIFNEYGPTEAVVGCMIHESIPGELPNESDVPIGVPAPNVHLRIVDRHLHPVPIGAIGELTISLPGLTSGYLGGSGDDAFVEIDGERAYRSGDLVRLVDEHTAIYLGRLDEQVKVGGIRLDPTEVERALADHPAVATSAMRAWSPPVRSAERHCVRCGLPSNVPGVSFDARGVCDTCHAYERVAPQAAAWFKTPDDLRDERDRARRERTGRHDCLHLLSGGKDSTYALYQLVEAEFEVAAMTLDNGFISEGAKENVRRTVADLGIDHEFATTEAMDAIFRDSLERHSNVCHGCYKTLYTLATNRAVELGIPAIVTGLSRGQLFETRLIPQQFSEDRFDPDAIDRAVIEARKAYHRVDDGPNRLLDTSCFSDDEVFDRVRYLDFYRYADVELTDMLEFLETRAPWVRPSDTGRSTNCLVNAAGIHTHVTEQGYHNYAVPYAWDVRLGHKRRDEAMDELDDQLDLAEVGGMLDRIGYAPVRREILTAWYELRDDALEPTPAELRTFLASRLPAHAIPAAFVRVDELPVTTNGKLDTARLPEPARVHRGSAALQVSPETDTEAKVVEVYERLLHLEPVGVTDDFFALGGDSLAALQMAVVLGDVLGRTLREDVVFANTTPRALAAAIDASGAGRDVTAVPSGLPDRPRARPANEPPPISAGEQGLLFEHLAAPDDPRYNVARQYLIGADLDVERFVRALLGTCAAHVPLHWTYSTPRRRLHPADAIVLDVATDGPPTDRAEFDRRSRTTHLAPIEIEHGPLGRCLIRRLDDGRFGVTLVFHHASLDAGGFDRLWRDLDARYRGVEIRLPDFDYADHTTWQTAISAGETERWLTAAPDPGTFRFPEPSAGAIDGYLELDASFTAAELRSGAGATLFSTELAALAVALRPYCDSDRVGIGASVSMRDLPDADALVGYYLNTLPVVLEVPFGNASATIASAAGDELAAAMSARRYPYGTMIGDRRRAGLPLPETSLLLTHEDWLPTTLGGESVEHRVLAAESAVVDATFFVHLRDDQVRLGIEHRGAVIDDPLAVTLLERFDRALRACIDHPTAPVALVDDPWELVGDEAQGQLDALGTGPPLETIAHDLLHEAILANARRDPDAIAVIADEQTCTYRELDERSALVARRLASRGLGRGSLVGVAADRRVEAVIAIVGVLRAGAAYVPIDPEYPDERIRAIVEGAQLHAFVAVSQPTESLATALRDTPVVEVSTEDDPPVLVDDRIPAPVDGLDATHDPARSDDLAYVIFTSGSTGRPKGVAVRHRNIVASIAARSQFYDPAPERFLTLSSFAFDSSMVGLFWPLTTGGAVVLPAPDLHDDVSYLAELAERVGVTHVLALPSLFELLLAEADAHRFATLTTAIVAGEACAPSVVRTHRERCPAALLVNEYGPTETTVWSHAHTIDASSPARRDDEVPIGHAIPGARSLVVDPLGRPVPVGESGELVISGPGVTAGYLGQPDLTAERFVRLPGIDPAATWYRTGDLVAWGDDGTLRFRGRVDHQVKVRGHRIELGEIERAMVEIPGVRSAVADVVEDPAGGSPRLSAWFVGDGSQGVDAASVLDGLRDRLPEPMVPGSVIQLDALPLGPNGKLDRAALEVPDDARSWTNEVDEPPRGPRETAVAEVWSDVFAHGEPIGRTTNFFDLGGDSILSIQVVARLRRLGLELSPRDVFDHQTVAEVAAVARSAVEEAEQGRLEGEVELLPIQRWFFELGLEARGYWNQTMLVELLPDVDVDTLWRAWRAVVDHHDALRTRFEHGPGGWQATIMPEAPEPEVITDPSAIDGLDGLEHRVAATVDIERGRLVGLGITEPGSGGNRVVVISIHHLVVDAVSWGPVLDDWATAYTQVGRGEPVSLPPKSSSVRSWSSALREWANSDQADEVFRTWAAQPRPHALPGRVADPGLERSAETASSDLDAVTTGALLGTLTDAGTGAGVTIEEVLVGAVASSLAGRYGWERVELLLEGHGREDSIGAGSELSRTVGWFTTLYPVSIATVDPTEPGAVLGEAAHSIRSRPDAGVTYGAGSYLRPDSPLVDRTLPSIAFNYLGQLDRSIRVAGPFRSILGTLHGTAPTASPPPHEVSILAFVRHGRLVVEVRSDPAVMTSAEASTLSAQIVAGVELLATMLGEGWAPDLAAQAAPTRLDLAELSDPELERLSDLLGQLEA